MGGGGGGWQGSGGVDVITKTLEELQMLHTITLKCVHKNLFDANYKKRVIN